MHLGKIKQEAVDKAEKHLKQVQSDKGLDVSDTFEPKAVRNGIAKLALEKRREAKEGETVTAGTQSKADHVIQLIEKHLASWSKADRDRVQAALNGVKS